VKRGLPPALAALVAFAVYASTIPFEFVYDDVSVILNNPRLHSLDNWREILVTSWWPRGLYRPLTSLTLAANWAAGGGAPSSFHLVNVLLHTAVTILVYLLGMRFLPVAGALAAALLFAVHPVHVEAVANLVGRAEVLASLFTIAAALLYLRYGELLRTGEGTRSGRWFLGGATLATLGLGLASKESAFAAPGILLVVDWARSSLAGEPFGARLRRNSPLWIGSVIVAVLWLALRSRILGDLAGDIPAPGLGDASLPERFVMMLPVFPEYLRLLLFPVRLSADYSPDFLPVSAAFGGGGLLGLALFGACVAVAVFCRRRAPMVSAGLGWAGVALLIVSNLIVPTGVLLAERTLYLASVGVCLAAGWLWYELFHRRERVAIAVLAILVAAGAARTHARAGVWRDNTTFFPQLVRDAPGSYRADWVAAMLAYVGGDSTSGERLMRKGLATYQGNSAMWADFARVMERQRRWSEAANYYWASFRTDPRRDVEAARAIASHIEAGELDSAQGRLQVAEATLPPSTDLAISASHLALARGDPRRALELRRRVALARPDDWRYWLLTADAAVRARSCEDLTRSIERLRSLRPGMPRLAQLQDSARAAEC
jgi:protein O-mannosyl-transferase